MNISYVGKRHVAIGMVLPSLVCVYPSITWQLMSRQRSCGKRVSVVPPLKDLEYSLSSSHPSLNRDGRWGTRGDFTTSFLHFPLFSTAHCDLANSRLVHSLMLSSHLFFCLLCLLSPFTVSCKMVLARPDGRETGLYHCSLRLFFLALM